MNYSDDFYSNLVPVDPISAATAIGGTIAQISDMKQRRDLETNLQFLDLAQRNRLEQQLQATNNTNDRIRILVEAVASIRAAQSSAVISSTIQAKAKRELTTAIIIVGGSLALLFAIVLIKRN